MSAGLCPVSAHGNGDDVIQLQGEDGRSTARRFPQDAGAVFAPGEMFIPILMAWIEQELAPARFMIDRVSLVGFEIIAQATSDPKIDFVARATLAAWQKVLDFKSSENQMLRTQTVTASIFGFITNVPSEFLGDIGAHDANGSRSPRRTASRVAIALRNSPS